MYFNQVSVLVVAGLASLHGVFSQDKFPLVGVHTGKTAAGQYPARKDIRDLYTTNKYEFSLLIQALNSVQSVAENNLTSYYQIGGIHGQPHLAWDGVNPKEMLVDGIPVGYCPHGANIFGMWHRPYLALIEQVIAKHAQVIAKKYNSSQWTKAADNLRLPFYDWALAPFGWPTNLLSTINITISTPSGDKVVRNPFYRYEFKGVPYPESWFSQTDGNAYFALQPHTLRSPNRETNVSNEASIIEEIPYMGPNDAMNVWKTFAKSLTFNDMATSNNGGSDFESIHGALHIVVGGHMGPADYTGFEPVFWLHHATVDRQFALWQAIRPDSWMTPKISYGGTWTIYPGTTTDENTPLTPFTRADKRTPHTSLSVRNISTFGYTYADIPHGLSAAATSKKVTARINQLYNPSGTLSRQAHPRNLKSPNSKREVLKEWTVNVKVPNAATGKAFAVNIIFEGNPLGSLAILAVPSLFEVATGSKRVSGREFSLAGLVGGEDESVKGKIRGGLRWVVVDFDGNTIPNNRVEGLEVLVAEQSVTAAVDENEFPVFGEKVYRPDILG